MAKVRLTRGPIPAGGEYLFEIVQLISGTEGSESFVALWQDAVNRMNAHLLNSPHPTQAEINQAIVDTLEELDISDGAPGIHVGPEPPADTDILWWDTSEAAAPVIGMMLWRGTQAQYDALPTKDANTLYAITDA